ncbi:MAG: S26 family signal peptidase [Treponema sp.]|jgi:signal peptidase I|nr:S26 family signal peptidase [Treponema sp.]
MIERTAFEKNDFFSRLEGLTENVLTRRRRVRRIKKEKQKAKNFILDWLEAFIWAAGVVLLINQYLFQAYQIPSGSMIDTLLIGDRIFVNKVIFGPELLPGMAKLPSPVKPKRNDVIIFENPSYISRGPAFDIAQRIIYMLTLSLVDIDRDESGEPKAHFLIKRAVGWEGDRFVLDRGEFRIRFAGETRWVREREFNAQRKLNHQLSRLMDLSAYPALEAAGKAAAYMDVGLDPPHRLVSAASPTTTLRYPDYLTHERARLETLRGAYPQDHRYGMLLARHTQGWYVPEGRILPLGDNRDNSRDGRYFGPIRETKVLGKGSIIYWPIGRLGPIW